MRSNDQIASSLKRLKEVYALGQAWKKEGWEEHQIKRGRIPEGLKGVLAKFTPLLEAIYPGNWDVQFDIEVEQKIVRLSPYRPIIFNEDRHNSRWQRHFNTLEEAENYTIHSGGGMNWNDYSDDVYIRLTPGTYTYPQKLKIKAIDFIIHFPEITISNSLKQSLQVKDLYIKFTIKEDGSITNDLHGTRTTFTLAEYYSGYIHSHISTRNFRKGSFANNSKVFFSSFCLGHGEIQTFSQFYNSTRNEGDLESYLHMLKTVASWESIEGGPHNSMSNTIPKTKQYPDIKLNDCQQIFDRLISRLSSVHCDIDWVFNKGEYSIVDNEKFEDFCTRMYYEVPEEYTVYKDSTGQYYVPTGLSPETVEVRPQDFIIFGGKKVYLKVEGELKFAGQRKRYINPKIKLYVKHKLESVCNKSQIRSNTIDRFHQSSNH